MTKMPPRILLFLKAPRSGLVKTRLAKDVGEEKSCRIYRQLVEHQIKQLPVDWPVDVYVEPPEALDEMEAWLGSRFRYVGQCPGDLGDRLQQGCQRSLRRKGSAVLCLGGDCPGLSEAFLRQAAQVLEEGAEVVFGPTPDGGYYLVGMKKEQPGLFTGIPWSSSETLSVSLQKTRSLGLKVALLPELSDVDTLADWERERRKFQI
ncbi:MAG: TIGR04282 family arsenosugar biosynthesis glycosyltransferase [Opitutales bacterium]|nr:TIGR04282 family arsenosugar biosynthesis glycosyltransferase [Opitutales bacterium]